MVDQARPFKNAQAHSRARNPTGTGWILSAVLFAILVIPSEAQEQQKPKSTDRTKNILILFGANRPDNSRTLDFIEAEIRKRVPGPVTFYETYLTSSWSPKIYESYQQSQAQAFRHIYGETDLSLVIAVYPQAVSFAMQYRQTIFPGIPIMFAGVGVKEYSDSSSSWPGVPGVSFNVGLEETIDLALRLHPDTKRMAIVGGPDWYWINEIDAALSRRNMEAVNIISLEPNREMVTKVKALGPNTVALLHTTIVPTRSEFGSRDLIREVSQTVPTYSDWAYTCLDFGCIGGVYAGEEKNAALTAEIAAKLLSGEKTAQIPRLQNTAVQAEVDWRALQRWHVPYALIPPGTLIQHREPTIWEQGRKYFLAFIGIILLQGLLILGLFWHRARRRKMEEELRKSEEKFSKTFRQGPLAVTITRMSDLRYLDVNETFEQLTGWHRDDVLGRTAQECNIWADSSQRLAFAKQLLSDGSVRNLEVQIRRKDGVARTLTLSADLIDVDGTVCALTSAADVTDHKEVQDVLSNLSQKLLDAQEKERTRIARELHDDVTQRLSILALQLSDIQEHFPEAKLEIEDAIQEASTLGDDIQALSHRLHSSKLEYLGLDVAAESFCKEFSARQNVEIDYRSENIPRKLPSEISLCLFRVLQESLQNAVKYSGERQFSVHIESTSNMVQLCVHDSGAGFDSKINANQHGLGLISMMERLKSLDGQLVIDSAPGEGTSILARIPLSEARPPVETASSRDEN